MPNDVSNGAQGDTFGCLPLPIWITCESDPYLASSIFCHFTSSSRPHPNSRTRNFRQLQIASWSFLLPPVDVPKPSSLIPKRHHHPHARQSTRIDSTRHKKVIELSRESVCKTLTLSGLQLTLLKAPHLHSDSRPAKQPCVSFSSTTISARPRRRPAPPMRWTSTNLMTSVVLVRKSGNVY